MSSSSSSSSSGVGFVGLLQILFIALKLCHVITWSWPVVLLPVIIGWTIVVLVCAIILIVALVRS